MVLELTKLEYPKKWQIANYYTNSVSGPNISNIHANGPFWPFYPYLGVIYIYIYKLLSLQLQINIKKCFSNIFFPRNQNILGPSIIHVIQEIFETQATPEDWGITNIALIPKVDHLDMITQFHPISLCITLHKLVSRIILQRLKPYITEIINPCQVVFVLGRRTSDNIILVQEIMRMMVRKTGPKGHMTLKLDLDKAYD